MCSVQMAAHHPLLRLQVLWVSASTANQSGGHSRGPSWPSGPGPFASPLKGTQGKVGMNNMTFTQLSKRGAQPSGLQLPQLDKAGGGSSPFPLIPQTAGNMQLSAQAS